MVRFNPSSKDILGFQPKTSSARALSEYILQISVGLYGKEPIRSSDFESDNLCIFRTKLLSAIWCGKYINYLIQNQSFVSVLCRIDQRRFGECIQTMHGQKKFWVGSQEYLLKKG